MFLLTLLTRWRRWNIFPDKRYRSIRFIFASWFLFIHYSVQGFFSCVFLCMQPRELRQSYFATVSWINLESWTERLGNSSCAKERGASARKSKDSPARLTSRKTCSERNKRGGETFNMMRHEHLLLFPHSPGEERRNERETHISQEEQS